MNTRARHGQAGVSMVELMVALLISSILLFGVLQIFASNKTTFRNIEGISQIQDNARAGIERMKMQVRHTGSMGCMNMKRPDIASSLTNQTAGATAVTYNENVLIAGVDNDTASGNGIRDGTDSFTIFSSIVADTSLAQDMAGTNSNIRLVGNPLNFAIDDTLVITDCVNIDIFRATNVTVAGNGDTVIQHKKNNSAGDQVNQNNNLEKPYQAEDSQVLRMRNLTYAIDTNRNDEAGNPVWSLFETVNGGAATEIMSGVEDMQVLYGEDTDSDDEAEVYSAAGAVGNMANVVSLRVTLLLSTDRNIGTENRPYTNLAGNAVTAANSDPRMRRTFTSTIGLRNRMQ